MGFTQCDIVADLSEFIDDCYLRILLEVMQNGNKSNLKLRKSSVKIDLAKHNYEEKEFIGSTPESLNWLSFQSIISDIYKSFRFESFPEKFSRINKGIDYEINKDWREMIFKHVIIRNCIQHHSWQLEASSLRVIGKTKIIIANDKNDIEIKEWQIIQLTKKELLKFIEVLLIFVDDFSKHTNSRIRTRHYKQRKKPAHNNA